MEAVAEEEYAAPSPSLPASVTASARRETTTPRRNRPTTPVSSAIKPPENEMHPEKHRVSVGEPSSALRLGFSDIKNTTIGSHAPSGTPSRSSSVRPSALAYKYGQETSAVSLNLSENAQRLLADLRESAARFQVELAAQRESERELGERKIAQPKGKSGRFSAAHMAEFKKMDSIEGHPSAWRASRTTPAMSESETSASKTSTPTQSTPARPGLKRSRSKANLDATPQSQVKSHTVTPSQSKQTGGSSNKRGHLSALYTKANKTPSEPSSSFAKRIKKYQNQDASSARPVSRGDKPLSEPRQTIPSITVVSPQSSGIRAIPSLTSRNVPTTSSPPKASSIGRRILSPRGFQKVKSILRGDRTGSETPRTAIPKPAASTSQTPGPQSTDKALPPLPLTTPRRKLVKQVSFTPDTKMAAAGQDTPSPKKSSSFKSRLAGASPHWPSMDGILSESEARPTSGDVVYPDLSAFGDLDQLNSPKSDKKQPGPGTFTFRSDHTINFDGVPTAGFGASAGQATLRQVCSSVAPKDRMPGSFPAAPPASTHPNKENAAPASQQKMAGAPHGMSNKKRHRVTWDEEDAEREEADRAAKKRKNEHVPEGHALVAPRMIAQTPGSSARRVKTIRDASRTPGSPMSPSPAKKKVGISISRLNALSRPKNRA